MKVISPGRVITNVGERKDGVFMLRKQTMLTLATLLVLLMSFNVCNAGSQAEAPLVLEKMGVKFVGGHKVISEESQITMQKDPQSMYVEQAQVHYFIPKKKKHSIPVVMLPGYGLRSSLYLSTPDGRDGWATIFAKNGFEVYVVDEPMNAAAGFDANAFREVKKGTLSTQDMPVFISFGQEEAWARWGIGAKPGVPFPDSQFPVENIDEFFKSFTPVFSQSWEAFERKNAFGYIQKANGLVALLDEIGPAIIITHSSSGLTGYEATRLRPNLIKAMVAIEPVNSPQNQEDVKRNFSHVPFLAVFGDYFEIRGLNKKLNDCKETARLIKENGGIGNVLSLTAEGVKGNSHLLMIDRNNQEIAQKVIKWLDDVNAAKKNPNIAK